MSGQRQARRALGGWIAILALGGCGADRPPSPTPAALTAASTAEPTMTQETRFDQIFEVQQSTVLRLANGWALGVQMVYEGDYADPAGQTQRGPLARLSVLDPQPGAKARTVTVFAGATVEAGAQYQVLEITGGPDDGRPGSSQSTVTLGQLP